jgi:hypothetical protein
LFGLMVTAPGFAQPLSNADLVDSWYRRYLGRPAELGARGWVDALDAGQAPEAVLASILSSDEYWQRSGQNGRAYVTMLFQSITGRRPARRETEYWLHHLRRRDRRDVAYDMLKRYPVGLAAAPPGRYDPDEGSEYRRPLDRYPGWRFRR